jgi:hypothetical protein
MNYTDPYGKDYRLSRHRDFVENAIRESDDERLTLVAYKCQEYRLRIFRRWPNKLPEELPRLYFARPGKVAVLEAAMLWRREQKRDPFKVSKWTIAKVKSQIQENKGLALPLGDHLTNSELCEHLRPLLLRQAEDGLLELAGRLPSTEDTFGERLRQVQEAFRLTALEVEFLLYAYLRKCDNQVFILHEKAKPLSRAIDGEFFQGSETQMNPVVLAVIVGCGISDLTAALSPEGTLRRKGLLDIDFEIGGKVYEFLFGGLKPLLTEVDS